MSELEDVRIDKGAEPALVVGRVRYPLDAVSSWRVAREWRWRETMPAVAAFFAASVVVGGLGTWVGVVLFVAVFVGALGAILERRRYVLFLEGPGGEFAAARDLSKDRMLALATRIDAALSGAWEGEPAAPAPVAPPRSVVVPPPAARPAPAGALSLHDLARTLRRPAALTRPIPPPGSPAWSLPVAPRREVDRLFQRLEDGRLRRA